MEERLTEYNNTGWVLKLNNPQNEFEAKKQLMDKFKLACEKLGKFEDMLEKHNLEGIKELDLLLNGMLKVWQEKCNAEKRTKEILNKVQSRLEELASWSVDGETLNYLDIYQILNEIREEL